MSKDNFSQQQKDYELAQQKKEREALRDSIIASQKHQTGQVESVGEIKRKKSIKTYRDFAINALKGNPTSLAKMIIKEKKKREIDYKYSVKNKKNISLIIISIILVLLGVATIASVFIFVINKKNTLAEKSRVIAPQSLIYFDYRSELEVDNLNRNTILNKVSEFIKESNIPIGSTKIIYFSKYNKNGYKELISAGEFYNILDTRVSTSFPRGLSDNFTFGIISTIEKISPFMILKIKNFDSIYINMLAWESSILRDIGDLFAINRKYFGQSFNDLSLYNKDSRVILNEEGKVIFGYSFIDMNTLIFFTGNDSFRKIISLLENQKEKK